MHGPWLNSGLNKTTIKKLWGQLGKYDYQLGITIVSLGRYDNTYSDYLGKCFVFLRDVYWSISG